MADNGIMTPEEKKAQREAAKKAKKAAKEAAAAKKKQRLGEGGGGNKGNKGGGKGKGGGGGGGKEAKDIRLREEYVNPTPKGEKKDITEPLPDSYSPARVEAAWYDWWEKRGFFAAKAEDRHKYKEKFVMVIPPPNVTGYLHMGHALTNAVEDVFCRYHRMDGKQVLWVPGADHAGIATQVVVEKRIKRELGKTRHDLGRDEFLKHVWAWKEEKGGHIFEQLRRLGSSLDWNRTAFTLDDDRQAAVREAFLRLHDMGIIYRSKRLGNWCCTLKTAIADIEVEHVDVAPFTKISIPGYEEPVEFGIIEDFGYDVVEQDGTPVPGPDGKPSVMRISTTRLETMLADAAVAIHPDDERYRHFHGKFVHHPYRNVRLPIVLDRELVKMDFGTACVKVTPAHDPNDYQCAKRHPELEFLNMLTDDGCITDVVPQFAGLPRYEARLRVREDLAAKGRHYGVRGNPMNLAFCERSRDVIEPMLKPQWWMDVEDVSKRAVAAVRDGELKIVPESHRVTWFRWMENSQPWCLSRQLWWGHRINAWLVWPKGEERPDPDLDASWIVARDEAQLHERARAKFQREPEELAFEQDADVLDTWFSSGLFPFAVFGWPRKSADLETFFPIELMETGEDILFFWVARMVMMSLLLMDTLPFRTVYLHTMVRDAHGRKMSKALGNVLDPIDVTEGIRLENLHEKLRQGNLDPREVSKAIEGQKQDFPHGISECGTDAMRFTLCTYTSQGDKINLNVNQIVADRNFCNKMWNVVKFAMRLLPEDFVVDESFSPNTATKIRQEDRWILSCLQDAIVESRRGLDTYNLGHTTGALKTFVLRELCDVHLEMLKPLVYDENGDADLKRSASQTLYVCLDYMFRLLHPFMPFVTEELWQRLPRRSGDRESIMISAYPAPEPTWTNRGVEKQMAAVNEIIATTRKMREDFNLGRQSLAVTLVSQDGAKDMEPLEAFEHSLAKLCMASKVVFSKTSEVDTSSSLVGVVPNSMLRVLVNLHGVDVSQAIASQKKKLATFQKDLARLEGKMSRPTYREKVPQKVQEEDQLKFSTYQESVRVLEKSIADIEKMAS